MRRRAFLSTAALAATGGCLEHLTGGRTHASDPWRHVSRTDHAAGWEETGECRLARGEYAAYRFRSDSAMTLTVRIATRQTIDVATFSRTDYEAYASGLSPDAIPHASTFGEDPVEIEAPLPSGAYALVFDNTGYGTAPTADLSGDFLFRVET